jgi:glycosyltransferase involved in cell wall biosynthesis
MNKYRIAIIGAKGIPAKSGAERVVEEVVKQIADKHHITIFGYRDYNKIKHDVNNIELISLPFIEGKIKKPVSYLFFTVFKLLIGKKYDIIHLHNVEAGFILPLLKLRYRRIISTAHGPGHDRSDKWNRIEIVALKFVEKIFLISSNIVTCVKKDLAKNYKRSKKHTYFIPNGVGTDEMIDREWAKVFIKQFDFDSGQFILFLTGRFLPTKGPMTLLKALRELESKIPTLFIGEQGYVPDYDIEFNQLIKITPFAHSHTVVDTKAKVLGLMENCRFLVFPSYVEAMSMVLLEAASIGTPIICSDIEENYDVMGEYATYFKVGDVNDLKEKIKLAEENYHKMRQQAEIKKKLLIREQSWKVVADKYNLLYCRLMQKG